MPTRHTPNPMFEAILKCSNYRRDNCVCPTIPHPPRAPCSVLGPPDPSGAAQDTTSSGAWTGPCGAPWPARSSPRCSRGRARRGVGGNCRRRSPAPPRGNPQGATLFGSDTWPRASDYNSSAWISSAGSNNDNNDTNENEDNEPTTSTPQQQLWSSRGGGLRGYPTTMLPATRITKITTATT